MSFWSLLLSFAPWFVLKIVADLPLADPLTMLKIALTIGALICLYQSWTADTKGSVLWGSLFFFAVAFVFVVPMTNMWFIVHMNLLAQLNLTVIALGSMLFKRPFTMDYAKKHVPEALWTHPRFVRKNYIITGVWAVYFILGLITAVVQLDHLPIGKIALEILDDGGMIGAMLFTSIYSKKRSVTAEPTA